MLLTNGEDGGWSCLAAVAMYVVGGNFQAVGTSRQSQLFREGAGAGCL